MCPMINLTWPTACNMDFYDTYCGPYDMLFRGWRPWGHWSLWIYLPWGWEQEVEGWHVYTHKYHLHRQCCSHQATVVLHWACSWWGVLSMLSTIVIYINVQHDQLTDNWCIPTWYLKGVLCSPVHESYHPEDTDHCGHTYSPDRYLWQSVQVLTSGVVSHYHMVLH